MNGIVNIIKSQQNTPEETLLKKDLNFISAIKQISNLDLIAPIEEASLKISKNQAD